MLSAPCLLWYYGFMYVTGEKIVTGGKCIAHIDGKTVFISGLLPEETAEIKITKSRRDYDEAETVKILEKSPRRIVPPCPNAGVCGGCSLIMAESGYQQELRTGILRDLLERFKCHYDGVIEIIPSRPFEYRSRFQFHKTAGGKPGLCGKASNRVIPVNDCPVAVPEIREMLADGELEKKAALLPGKDRINVFAFAGKKSVESPVDTENLFTIVINNKKITFDIRSFFQSNIPAFEKAASTALSGFRFDNTGTDNSTSKGKTFLDFYSGCGVFSVMAENIFQKLFLVEENAMSIAAAENNLGRNISGNKTDALFFRMKDREWTETEESKMEFDGAVIDPPRTGIGKKTLSWLFSAKIKNLRYLSCEPSTFARDTAELISNGWKLEKVFLCDFYPQTHHIETLGFFSRTEQKC